jgi:hypothetical protein
LVKYDTVITADITGLIQLHHAVDAAVSGTSLVLNGCLLYLILTRPLFAVKALKRIFLLTCLSDIALGTSVFIGSPVIFAIRCV